MSEKAKDPDKPEDSFVQRWSRRKLEHKQALPGRSPQHTDATQETSTGKPHEPVVRESDLPPVESLNADSEVSMFFGEGISEKLRQQALRKLFHFGKFNVVDGLDDYAEDYTIFQPLYHLYSSREDIQKLTRKVVQRKDDETTPTAAFQIEESEPVHPESLPRQDNAIDDEPGRED